MCISNVRLVSSIRIFRIMKEYTETGTFLCGFTSFLSGTTASILKTVAVCVGVLLAICIATFVCWKCIKPEEEDKEETGHAMGTECTHTDQASNEPEAVM